MVSIREAITGTLLLAVLTAQGKIINSPAQLSQTTYDFVILGGGTAGCVLANRLTENPAIKVLVVEAGASPDGIVNAAAPFLGVTLPGSQLDWNFTSTPQAGLAGRSIPYARGFTLGGSSVINLLTWNRGSNDLWNKWASITNDPGWAWANVEKFYLKTSRIVAPADNHNTTGEFIPSAHGNGSVEVSLPGFPTELDPRVINASQQLGGRFAFNEDLNAGNSVGISLMQSSIGGGQRSHAAAAYLDPILSRPNLDVLINTQFTRLIQSGGRGNVPEFKLAEIAQSPLARRYLVRASKEIIVSAGVFGTPHLLLLSGIGPKSDLQKLGINAVVNNPSVGKNLTDHPLMPNYFLVNSTQTFDKVLHDPSVFNSTLGEWLTSKQGLFVDSPGNTQGFMRLPNDSSIFNTFKDPASGPQSGHTELIFIDGFAQFGPVAPPATGNFMTILTAVTSPVSRGSVSLTSSNPFTKPLINPAVLTSDFDIFAMVQSMKDAQAFIESSPWKNFVVSPFGALANATTDALRATLARSISVTVNHPAGSASMSPAGAPWGVVDSNLLLKGATGVRIADASVFPLIPECHIQAPVYIVAERAADLIKQTYNI